MAYVLSVPLRNWILSPVSQTTSFTEPTTLRVALSDYLITSLLRKRVLAFAPPETSTVTDT